MESTLTHPLVEKAAEYAKECHKHQLRKTGEPYFIHPEGVAKITAEWTNDPDTIAAAYLHDVIEDTGKDFEDIESRFGKKVAHYVSLLSRDFRKPKPVSLREFRKVLFKAPPPVKLIASADALHNASTPADKEFMIRWFKKIKKNLKAVTQGKLGIYRKAIQELMTRIKEAEARFMQS